MNDHGKLLECFKKIYWIKDLELRKSRLKIAPFFRIPIHRSIQVTAGPDSLMRALEKDDTIENNKRLRHGVAF